jgi:hypothetical protein
LQDNTVNVLAPERSRWSSKLCVRTGDTAHSFEPVRQPRAAGVSDFDAARATRTPRAEMVHG